VEFKLGMEIEVKEEGYERFVRLSLQGAFLYHEAIKKQSNRSDCLREAYFMRNT
jgi:hypothetical protein